uniref:FTH domain-containing protein n=1 Tax=Caenorhabditis tropicalis TaxID=1561998 RepID=A0A1I7URU3_9PELO
MRATVRMSREILFSIRTRKQRRLSDEQIKVNKDTRELVTCCINELYFVIKAQPFPYTRVLRLADVLMEHDRTIMKMLDTRHLITADVFDNDQIVFGELIEDFRKEIGVQYKELYKFMLTVEETHAFEGFRAMFDLPEYEDNMEEEERHIANFVNRKFVWLNGGPGPVWLFDGLQFYNNFPYVTNEYKNKLMSRYGPE